MQVGAGQGRGARLLGWGMRQACLNMRVVLCHCALPSMD